MAVRLTLFDLDGNSLGKTYDYIAPATFLFGRDPSAHHCAGDDPVVSRKHFFIEIAPPRARLHDLGSRNGVRVNEILYGGKNGRRTANGMAPPIELRPGDRIRVGKTLIEIQLCADQAAASPDAGAAKSPPFAAPEDATIIVPRVQPTQVTPPAAVSGSGAVAGFISDAADYAPPRIPGYHLVRELGDGGMGTVYLATDTGGREVAIKVMYPGSALTDKTLVRFRREISIARSLFHENIVTCIEDGCADDMLYLVMEYLPHGSLSGRLMRSGPFTPEAALPFMIQILTGLAFAHSRNLVHRDLKPANVLFGGERGEVAKLTDFGLAKSYVDSGLSSFTITGTAAGTLTCLPPEQLIDFKRVLPSADVFSLGATFYEMLAGRPPYNTSPDQDAMAAVLAFDLTPLGSLRPDLPPGFLRRIDRALREHPEDRYADGQEMLAAFRELVK